MSGSALYDEDILLWSEGQAAIIRGLGRIRGLPSELDIENVAEEIESVGRSELASVQSFAQLILLHLIKLVEARPCDAARHWRAEVVGFHGDTLRRYAPSMRQRMDLDALWRQARSQAILASDETGHMELRIPEECPFSLDDILDDRIDTFALTDRLRSVLREDPVRTASSA